MIVSAAAWAVFAIFVLLILGFALWFTRYFFDKNEPHSKVLISIVVIWGLALTLSAILLIPIDIYVVSSSKDTEGNSIVPADELAHRMSVIAILYYVLFGSIMISAFVIVPFVYFYFEEEDGETSTCRRMLGALKYTVGLLIVAIVLFVVGIFLKPGEKPDLGDDLNDYIDTLLDTEDQGAASVAFAVACLSLLGYLCLACYTAFGMAALPIGMIKGDRKKQDDRPNDLATIQAKLRELRQKYIGGRKVPKRDKEAIARLEKMEDKIKRSQERDSLLGTSSLYNRIAPYLRPLAIIFGVIFFCLSTFLIVCLILTGVDRSLNSICGASCGFVLDEPKVVNPFDVVMMGLERYFPADFIVLVLVVLYFFASTVAGIVYIGVRLCCCLHLFHVAKGRTAPQGLLLVCLLLMLSLLALCYVMCTLAPTYTAYGTQDYIDGQGQVVRCHASAPPGANCAQSGISTIVSRVSIKIPFFGVAFFSLNWLVVGVYFMSVVVVIIRRRDAPVDNSASSDEYA